MKRPRRAGFDYRCPCGWRSGRLRSVDEVARAISEHHAQHAAVLAAMAARVEARS